MVKNSIKTILLIEDDPEDAHFLREMLNEPGKSIHVNCISDAEKYLAAHVVDILLLDLGLPDAKELEALRRTHAAAPQTPLVVLTGLDDEALGEQAVREGAEDFLIKGQIEIHGLPRALRYAIERKLMAETLFAEKERAQVTLDSIGDAVICTDVAGNVSFLNAAAERLTGWSQREAEGRPLAEVSHILDATTCEITPNRMKLAVARDRTVHLPLNCSLIRREGVEISIEDSASPIHDRSGRRAGAVIVFHDVSASRAMTLAIAHAAHHDSMAGLPNRLLSGDRVDRQSLLQSATKIESLCCF